MKQDPILLTLGEKRENDPAIEATTSLGYLREIRDQLERTAEWDQPCLFLTIAQRPKMVGRIGAYVSGGEYDKISGGELGPDHTSHREVDEKMVRIMIELRHDQMMELAAINKFDSPHSPHHWTTNVSEQNANEIIKQIDAVVEKIP